MAPEGRFILDTSALLALRGDEAGAGEIESLLKQAEKKASPVLVSFMSRMEMLYLIWREEGEAAAREALRLIDTFPIEWVSCDADILETAASFKAKGGLSVADCWIAATAIVRKARLIHKDPEFARVASLPQQFLKA